ncbi:MAG: hypothetical protein ABIS50_16690 [Luteolibacter sp.]|uniref:hypothetical protein n=1 Tax=Luteolibacter sp. TaxID=1962973 RepID=UPI003262DE7A
MKKSIAASVLIVLSAGRMSAADGELSGDYEKLTKSYRTALEDLQKRAAVAADNTTAKKIQKDLTQMERAPSDIPVPVPVKATSNGKPNANSAWQGTVTIKKERDLNDYSVKATILESDDSGFTLDAKFLNREWVYKFRKANNKLELASAEAKSGAGIVKGITKIYDSKIEVITEAGTDVIKIHAVRKDGNAVIDASYVLRPEP